MSTLVQGVLADNSVSPDVDIQEFKKDSVRSHLKNAINKKAIPSRQQQSIRKLFQPVVVDQAKSTSSDNFLAYEVAKLANKLDAFEKNAKLLEKNKQEEKTLDLEKKISKITEDRLQYLEKLQHEQEQWKSQYFQTIKKLNNMGVYQDPPQSVNSQAPNYFSSSPAYHKAMLDDKQLLLQTPLPRKHAPKPTSEPGNGKFLQDILDQCNASSPDMSMQNRIGPVDTVPVRLTEPFAGRHPNLNITSIPSPVKPSAAEIVAKEIESEAERKTISEKFPNSISEYFPGGQASPVSHLLTKTVPHSSLVSDFRSKLRQLVKMRSNLESNLQAVQTKPKLNDIATAALVEAYEDDDAMVIDNEKKCLIQKLVDEQICIETASIKEDVAIELKEQHVKSKKLTKYIKPTFSNQKPVPNQPNKSAPAPKKKKKKQLKFQYQSKENEKFKNADDSLITHVYGKAEYHPHRTTVHNPFMHISPIKSPKFRNKRALQSVPATYVRSEKTQTHPNSPTVLKSKYLAPTAIALGPPRIHENEPDPIIVPAAKPVIMMPESSPKKSPILVKRVEIIDKPDKLPGADTVCECSLTETPPCETELQVCGQGTPTAKIITCPKRRSPSPASATCDEKIETECAQDKVKCWIEQEIMSRIVRQLYKGSSEGRDETSVVDEDTLRNLVENEVLIHIREQLQKARVTSDVCETKPKTLSSPGLCPLTPVPTPCCSPCLSEKSCSTHYSTMKTPPLSSESSVEEEPCSQVSIHSPEPSSAHEPEPDIVPLPTPAATPVPSPEASSHEPISSVESLPSFPDPWEGKIPKEDLEIDQAQAKTAPVLAPEPIPTDLVVRTLTPKPEKVLLSSLSESSSSEESTSEDKPISEGQLIIEHGEMRVKRRPLRIPESLAELVNENTMRDVPDLEPISEGEFRPFPRGPMIPTKFVNFVEDDPTAIYARPRKPAATSESEELSVGEIPSKRNKFNKWKASRKASSTSSPQSKPNDDPSLSVGDLNSTDAHSSVLEDLAPNVIMVTSATPRNSIPFNRGPGQEVLAVEESEVILMDSLDAIVAKPRSQMTLTLPSTEAVGVASDTDDVSM